ncbi:MAG: helix-turn-helix transcriptional regulator [Streptosporangiaceae bacterium]
MLDVVVAVAAEGVGDALALDLEVAGPDRPVALGAVQDRRLGGAAGPGGLHVGLLGVGAVVEHCVERLRAGQEVSLVVRCRGQVAAAELQAGPMQHHGPWGGEGDRLKPLSECLVHLDALASLRHRPPALHRPDIVGRLALMFGQLGQAVAQTRGEQHEEPGTAHPAVVQAMRLLEADLARDWTLTGLAAELHLAPGYLVRLFNAATGLPPMAYLAQLRAEHAAVLLLHSDEPVTSIGRTVGWPDQGNFARRFKAHYGLSATTYRKSFATGAVHLQRPAAAAS